MEDEKPISETSKREARREQRQAEKEETREIKLDDLVLAIHRTATVMADAEIFSKHGVTVGEWAMLKALGKTGEAPLADVIRIAGISRQRLAMLLSEAEEKGFIKVVQSDDSDRRFRKIVMQPLGVAVVNRIGDEFSAMVESIPALGTASTKRLGNTVRMMLKFTNVLHRGDRTDEEVVQKRAAEREALKADRVAEKHAAKAERQAERAKDREKGKPLN